MKENTLKDRNRVAEEIIDSGSKSPTHVSAKALISRLDRIAKGSSKEAIETLENHYHLQPQARR
ncbi:MAG: hypothetical protein K0S08_1360 [Gammaproteobacteria bacterium]|jgi:hypothetical protein|nr:hypothetical protein [Gammaproteobacteria bacterium]